MRGVDDRTAVRTPEISPTAIRASQVRIEASPRKRGNARIAATNVACSRSSISAELPVRRAKRRSSAGPIAQDRFEGLTVAPTACAVDGCLVGRPWAGVRLGLEHQLR